MTYWDDDTDFLSSRAELEADPNAALRLFQIARDLRESVPDAGYLEDLASKICNWSSERVVPTPEFAEEIAQNLRGIGLILRRDPSQ